MECIMDDYEIFLSKLANRDELCSEVAKKLNPTSEGADADVIIKDFFSSAESAVKVKLYISNEDVQNDEVDKIVEIFSDCSEKYKASLEIIRDEFLNIIDSEDRITSKSKPRCLVHRDGDLHPTVHVWIIKRMDMGIYVLLQKSAACKDTHPGCYDVSAAGHVSQGGEFRDSAVRELEEELGIHCSPEKFDFMGLQKKLFRRYSQRS